MNLFDFFIKSKYFVVLTVLVVVSFLSWEIIYADYMQSSTYRIQSDSLNFGGVDSSSPNYKLSDTLGEVGTGDSNSYSYYMHAGYQQMSQSYISISSPIDLTLASIGGLSGESSEGTVSWNIVTDNAAGYNLSIATTTSPALKSTADSFADYTPAGADPDYNFTNGASSSSFGFSPEGTEVLPRYLDDGATCNTSSSEHSGKCWDGLSTVPKIVAGGSFANMPSGGTATVRFRAESGNNHVQTSGLYSTTIVVTATTL